MSPEQLKTLQKLSQLFENGTAGPTDIKKLSSLLAEINQPVNWTEESGGQSCSAH